MSTILNNHHKINDIIISEPLPYQRGFEDVKQYAKPIGDKLYVNTTIGSTRFMNNHGVSAIMKMENGSDSLLFDVLPNYDYDFIDHPFNSMDATWICNIKSSTIPYGGNKYVNRVNSTYINCVSHKVSDGVTCVFGGDTYLNVFDYAHTTVAQ
jgi:hypothetical protein